MAKVQSFSIADSELEIWEEFKELCKKRRHSVSWELTTLMAREVQKEKEKQDDNRRRD